MPSEVKAALHQTACIAFRTYDQLTETEREAVLLAIIETASDQEAELAQKQLFHLREHRRLQLTLRGLWERAK